MGKKKFIIAGIILFLAIGSLGWVGLTNSATYYYGVNEFLGRVDLLNGQSVRINGTVIAGSIETVNGGLGIRFVIKDTETASVTLPVVYRGAVPDTFKPDNEIVVEGKYSREGIFEASTLLTKCASKYEPALTMTREAGRWPI